MDILITICARGGSKGIPGKNVKTINGRPLIYYTIKVAKEFAKKFNADITISTDSDVIKSIAREYGLYNNYVRPELLSTDDAGKIVTILDVLNFEEINNKKKYKYIIDLDVTSPLRNVEDIENALGLLEKDDDALNVFSVNYANRNPYFNMVEKKDNGYYNLVKEGTFLTRQSAPSVFELNASIYVYRRIFFSDKSIKVINEYSLIYLMPHICFDLDHNIDFDYMNYLLTENRLDFNL
jgi:CMP-N,N'-diacetyllegionaminic acid synthase